MSNNHCINCLHESTGLYEYPCASCNWYPEQYSNSGLYLSPGTILHGQYQIAKLLGHGGFGITYLAWDNLLEIKLAIKEYMPRDFATRNSTNSEISTFAGDAQANFSYGLERFLEEARTLAKFQQHNGIVSVLNVFYGNGTGYMVMEYVDGLTLKEYLIQKDKLTWEQTLKLFMPVMDALREVHKYGMLHRDISPDNIYLCRDNRVKLLDFGSARYALGGHSRSLSVVVKPGYAPEEQYRTKGNQGPWTDVYSVAASMYRCITGLVPPDALDRLDEDELRTPSKLGINIPDKAERELMAALAIKSNKRTQSIEAFQKELLSVSNVDSDAVNITDYNSINDETEIISDSLHNDLIDEKLYTLAIGDRNCDYYLSKFKKFDNKKGGYLGPSANISAFYCQSFWLLYRKMYALFFAYIFTFGSLFLFLEENMHEKNLIIFKVSIEFFSWIIFSVYANSLYHNSIKKKILTAKRTLPSSDLEQYLADKGGVNRWVIWVSLIFLVGYVFFG
jgi:serine/threonine protein kinase